MWGSYSQLLLLRRRSRRQILIFVMDQRQRGFKVAVKELLSVAGAGADPVFNAHIAQTKTCALFSSFERTSLAPK